MLRLARTAILILLLVAVPAWAVNENTDEPEPQLLIVEFMTGSVNSADDEFVEIYNASDELVSADNLKLQYKTATGTTWNPKTSLSGDLQPRGRYLISTAGLVESADIFRSSLGLAASGGHLRLVKDEAEPTEYDQIAWGQAASAQTAPMPAPDKDQSMKRRLDEDGRFIDTNDDSQDFTLSLNPSPERSEPLKTNNNSEPKDQPAASPSRNYSSTSSETGSAKAKRSGPFASIKITELMIDPDKPLTDAEDEFIELYNPNAEAVDLEDYRLETGMKFSYGFTLPAITLKPGEYLALYSLDTNLTLSNSEGQAQLLDPSGQVMFSVPAYTKAKPNTSWALVGEQWQWTTEPTPGQPNVAAVTGGAAGSNNPSGTNQGVLGASSNRSFSDNRNVYEEPPALAQDEMDRSVVAGVGSMALLYAGYEYRYDIGNRFNQLRRYLEARRSGRKSA